ncbi:hypothetical protein F5146DRAFT_1006228 [Armillaria mellea]|nr:hypothetical protein F5146DRAFT_1006228 [Armillaria mellea]
MSHPMSANALCQVANTHPSHEIHFCDLSLPRLPAAVVCPSILPMPSVLIIEHNLPPPHLRRALVAPILLQLSAPFPSSPRLRAPSAAVILSLGDGRLEYDITICHLSTMQLRSCACKDRIEAEQGKCDQKDRTQWTWERHGCEERVSARDSLRHGRVPGSREPGCHVLESEAGPSPGMMSNEGKLPKLDEEKMGQNSPDKQEMNMAYHHHSRRHSQAKFQPGPC